MVTEFKWIWLTELVMTLTSEFWNILYSIELDFLVLVLIRADNETHYASVASIGPWELENAAIRKFKWNCPSRIRKINKINKEEKTVVVRPRNLFFKKVLLNSSRWNLAICFKFVATQMSEDKNNKNDSRKQEHSSNMT